MNRTDSKMNWWDRSALLSGFLGIFLLLLPGVRHALLDGNLVWLYMLLFSFIVAFTVTPLMRRIGLRWGLIDVPGDRRIHEIPTARIGGAAVFLGFGSALLLNLDLSNQMIVILLAGFFLMAVGIIDDARGVPAWWRLLAQVGAVGLVLSWGCVINMFPEGPIGDFGNILLTTFWIIGITNAFNFIDGMDGLAGGLAVLIAFFIGILSFQTGQVELGWVSAAVIGAGLGFLPYNYRMKGPALIFLGDSGASFLGFTLACLAIVGDWSNQNPFVSFSCPILIFWVLIYDMVHITVERVITGKVRSVKEWIDYVGKDHLHHRLERALGGRRLSVLMIYTLTVCLGLGAMALRQANPSEAVILLTQAFLIVVVITILEYRGRSVVAKNLDTASQKHNYISATTFHQSEEKVRNDVRVESNIPSLQACGSPK